MHNDIINFLRYKAAIHCHNASQIMSSQKLCYTGNEKVVDVGAKWKAKTHIGMTYPTNFGAN